MKSTLLILVCTVIVGASLFGAAYWGQLRGIESSTKIEAAYIPVVRFQANCIDSSDWDCVRVTQKTLADILAARLLVLQERSLVDDSIVAEVRDYLEWYEGNHGVD